MSEDTVTTPETFHADVRTGRNDTALRYELHVAGDLAVVIDYREFPGHIELVHTVAEPEFAGRGLARILVRYALDDVVAAAKRIVPSCPFVRRYLAAHPGEYTQFIDQR